MNFYVITTHRFDDSLFAYGEEPENINLGPSIKCDVCSSSLTLMKWLPPYEINLSRRKMGDFIFGTFQNFIVSSRFRKYFENEDLKGIKSFRPVSLYFRKKLLDEEYYYPEIELADIPVDWMKSGIEFNGTRECPRCFRAGRVITGMKGLVFERADDIELDVFNPKTFTLLVVSERFQTFVARHEFSNLSMVESSRYKPNWIFT